MKKISLVMVVLGMFWMNSLYAQSIRCGVIIDLEDSINHHYIGITIFQLFHKKYLTPFDLSSHICEKAFSQLAQQFPEVEFVEIDKSYHRDLKGSLKGLYGRAFKKKRLDWFQELKQEYNIDNILILTHDEQATDRVGNSKYSILGYGIYNGVYPASSAVYFRMVRYLYNESDVSSYHARNNTFARDALLPRNTTENQLFSDEQLLTLESKFARMVELQVEEIVGEPWLARRINLGKR